jgi:hypothetical protein
VTFRGISLGCGNFGGIGSAPEFFGHGIPDTIETFVRLREEGLIGAWGLSARRSRATAPELVLAARPRR